MLAIEEVPNSIDQKHEAILERLDELLDEELSASRRGADNHETIVHIQEQMRFHKDCLATIDW